MRLVLALLIVAACGKSQRRPAAPPSPAATPAPGSSAPPPAEHPAAGATPVSVRMFHQQCARFSDGELWCWGQPEVAASPQAAVLLDVDRPRRVDVGGKVAAFDIGDEGIAALDTGGVALWAWRPDGQVAVRTQCKIHDAVLVGASQGFALAATRAGDLVAWIPREPTASGACDDGAVAPIPGVARVTALGCTLFGCCAVHDGGKLTCFRPPSPADDLSKLAIYAIPKLADVDAISVGDCQALARRRDHSIVRVAYCGGPDLKAAAAGKDPFVRAEPAKDLAGARLLGAGGCAVTGDGKPWCFGASKDELAALGAFAAGSVDFEFELGTGDACGILGSGQVMCLGPHGARPVAF